MPDLQARTAQPAPNNTQGTGGVMAHSASVTGVSTAAMPAGTVVQTLFHQLAQSLTVLSGSAELLLEGRVSDANAQAIRMWLQPSARQAETSMRRLRDLRLAQSPAATELTQCLTVLVLAADMISQGQLSGESALDSYALLRRNADRAMKSLRELRTQI